MHALVKRAATARGTDDCHTRIPLRHFKKQRRVSGPSMSIDELWELHADVIFEFDQKLLSEEIELEERLRHIHAAYRSRRPIGLRRFDA